MYNNQLQQLGDGPFQRLTRLLADVDPPRDREPIVLSIGEPRHRYPDFVGDEINRARDAWGVYPPTTGTNEYRQATAEWVTQRYSLPAGMIEPDRNIVPLCGTREGLFLIAQTVVPERCHSGGPVVLIPNPFYHCYAGAAVAAGAKPVFLPATAASGFLPDFSVLSNDVLAQTVLVYLCSPANPQGAVADLSYLKKLVELGREFDFVVVVDECYAEIYIDDPPPGVLEACADLDGSCTNVLAFHSLSKRSSAPGLRCGFAAGDADLVERFIAFRNYGSAQVPMPIYAAGTALWRDEDHVAINRALYREKFDAAQELLAGHYEFYRPPGAFFLWLAVGDGEAATRELWARGAIRVLPGAYLAREVDGQANPGGAYIRVALVDDLTTTREALTAIRSIL